jgi:predicted nucleotidyltransferase
LAIADALTALRRLKDEGALKDFMLFGSVAAMAHTRPFYTRDVDVAVAVESDTEFAEVFRRFASLGRVEGHAVVIDGTPIELFPADISPVIRDAFASAGYRLVEGLRVKTAGPEHLLIEALRVWRSQDRARAVMLADVADRRKLRDLFERLDHDGELRRRFKSIGGQPPEGPGAQGGT